MSFGFGVGDFLAVFNLAQKIRKDFAGAPAEFKGALDVVRSLSIVLPDVDVVVSEWDLGSEEETRLQTICDGCQNILTELDRTLAKYSTLESQQKGVGHKLKRVWQRISLEPEDIRNLRIRVNDNITLLNAFTSRQIRSDTVKLVRYQEDHEAQEILNWLTPVDYFTQQHDLLKQRQAGTGQWFLNSTEFKIWTETKGQTLFCPGIPGAGKTILTSTVIEEISTRFRGDYDTAVAFVYCNFKLQSEQSLEDLLASLLKQLSQCRPGLPQVVKTLYKRYQTNKTLRQLSADEISTALRAVAAEYSRVFILTDALDECRTNDGCLEKLQSHISELQSECGVNYFATSRLIPEIMDMFDRGVWLEIRASDEDVRRYVEEHIPELPRFVRRDRELKQEISSEIVKTIDGMFLLAQLHLQSLKGKRAPTALRDALKRLPSGSEAYDIAYSDAMARIEGQLPDQAQLAKEVLSWITCAKRPLSTLELQHALAINENDKELNEGNISDIEDIVSVCAGLVTVDEEGDIIRLVHYTTQEFFERTRDKWFPSAEFDITGICVTYLLFEVFDDEFCPTDSLFQKRLLLHPFYGYTAQFWGQHAHQASSIHPKVAKFCQSKTHLEAAAQAMKARMNEPFLQMQPKDVTGLHLAAHFGLAEMVAISLQYTEVDSKDFLEQTPLYYAATEGHAPIVKQLLDAGADIEMGDCIRRTALLVAAAKGHEAVVKLLIEKGANVDRKDVMRKTALFIAAERGHWITVKQLLDAGADIETKDFTGATALLSAAMGGHEAVVKLLIEKGASMNIVDSYGWTALRNASSMGHVQVMRLLTDEGADLTVAAKDGWTPWHTAAEDGHIEAVRLLFEKGADIAATTHDGLSLLHLASRKGHTDIVKFLLSTNRIDPGVTDDFGRTALFLASRAGKVQIVEALLASGKVNWAIKDWQGVTALSAAVRNDSFEVTDLLLSIGGCSLEDEDSFGYSVMWWARHMGNPRIIQLLEPEPDAGRIESPIQAGATVYDVPDLNFGYPRWCNVCSVHISSSHPVHRCQICSEKYIYMLELCEGCFQRGFRCHASDDPGHGKSFTSRETGPDFISPDRDLKAQLHATPKLE